MRLLPRDERFFELFNQLARHAATAGVQLQELFTAPAAEWPKRIKAINDVEHEADEVTHQIIYRLDRAFITPFDREDIHLLTAHLDDVVDRIDSCSARIGIYRIRVVPAGADLLADVIHQAALEVCRAVTKLEKGPPADVLASCREIKRLEEVGDALYEKWLGALFDNPTDPIQVIKWKEIYDTLERTLDSAEDVANVLESITIKHG